MQVGATTVAPAKTPATAGARNDHPQPGSSPWFVIWLFFCVFKCCVCNEGRRYLIAKRTADYPALAALSPLHQAAPWYQGCAAPRNQPQAEGVTLARRTPGISGKPRVSHQAAGPDQDF